VKGIWAREKGRGGKKLKLRKREKGLAGEKERNSGGGLFEMGNP